MPLSGHTSPVAVVGVTVSFTAVAAIAVGLRLWARLGIARNAGWDDILITLAMMFSIATTTTIIIQVEHGMGRHQDTIGRSEGMAMLKAFYVSICVYNLSLSCTKVSILLQYLRIFPQKRFRIACYSLLGLVVVCSLYTFFTAVFACTPIAFFWDQSIGGTCLDRFAIWFANSGINIGTDILIAILPLPMLKGLELPKRQKMALMIVFGLAGFTCIVSILRFQSLYVISQSTDVSWDNPLAAIWSSLEANTAIICSCLPTLRCFFPSLLRSQLSSSGASRDGDQQVRATPKLFPSVKSKIVSSISANGPPAYRYRDGDTISEMSLEELGTGERCSHHRRGKSHCRGHKAASDDIELDPAHERRPFPSGIHITTAIKQEVERKNGSDSSSTRELVRKKEEFEVV